MPLRHDRIRPAEPHEVALALLELVTVQRRPVPARTALEGLMVAVGGAAATVIGLIAIGWLLL